jgi:hypothetical protein
MRLDSSGRLGLGTSSPGQNITIQSVASGTAPTFKLQNPIDSNSSINAANNLSAGQLLFGATGAFPLTAKIESVYDPDASFGRSASLRFSGADGSGALSERMRIDTDGRLLVGTSSDSGGALLQVNGDRVRIATAKTPASASGTGTTGEICWDANYIYVCTATNTWKRTAISTW